MRWLAGFVGLLALFITGADEKQNTTDPITRLGTYSVVPEELSVKVYDDRGGINFRICQTFSGGGGSELGPSKPLIEKGTKWFIYAESPKKIWVYDGAKELYLYWSTSHVEGGVVSTEAKPDLVKEAPKHVQALLPKSFKDKFKFD